ncbi:MAG: hypothetical protein KGZ97_00855 [Bacteroidetes bacterium]|nr:hypothetical protein [Bacteroidota bacterium]
MKRFFISLLLLFPLLVFGQIDIEKHEVYEEVAEEKEVLLESKILSIVPQYFFASGLRVDFDIKITNNHWIQTAPVIYVGSKMLLIRDYTNAAGVGLSVYHRYYPGLGYGSIPVYVAWGPGYQYTNVEYKETSGMLYLKRNSKIHKAALDFTIGVYSGAGKTVVFDFYMGMGIRHSFINSDGSNPKKFNDFYYDYGYSGTILLLGARIGLPLK